MKAKPYILAAVLVALNLAGCAASGPTYREYSANIPAIPSDSGRIYLYRMTMFGGAIQPEIRINGDVVGKAVPKGFFFVDRPAGNYEISLSTEAKRSLTFNLEAGQEKYVRLEAKMGAFVAHIKPVLVDNFDGKSEITKTKYIVQ